MTQTTALVPTGIITVCCGLHILPPESCCDSLDCGPCCAECPTCPLVAVKTPERRRAEARAMREFTADLISMHRATIRAVEASFEILNMSDDEIAVRTTPCSGCAGESLVHTLDYRCNWNGLPAGSNSDLLPADPVCTCGDYEDYPVCDIHIWVGPAFYNPETTNG